MSRPSAIDAFRVSPEHPVPAPSTRLVAMELILSFACPAECATARRRADWWNSDAGDSANARNLGGKTLGLIGCDAVAVELARHAYFDFGMKVLIQSATPIPAEMLVAVKAEHLDTLDELLPRSDFVSLHCSGSGNRHLISGPQLDLMTSDAVLINSSDAQLVNEHALTQALMFETIRGAGLCVSDTSAPKGFDLMQCDNAVMLPRAESQAI